MRPVLFLHAGFHKTGTTAIQQFAARNRRRLKAGGVLYPRLWPATFRPVTAHHFLFHALAGQGRHLEMSQAYRLLQRWHRHAVSNGCTVLLSSEAICRYIPVGAGRQDSHASQFAENLNALLSDFDVRPVLVVRRQDDYVRSLYQEHVAAGAGASARLSFSSYLSNAATNKARFLERLRAFRELFGQVKVLIYEEMAGESLPVPFLREFGVDGFEECEAHVARPSLSIGETLVKQQLNHWISRPYQNRLALMWLRSRAVQRILRRELGECNTLWPDATTRARFVARFEEENSRIAREFLGRDDKLFPSLEEWSPAQTASPGETPVAAVLRLAARAARWRLKAIIGRKAVSEVLLGQRGRKGL